MTCTRTVLAEVCRRIVEEWDFSFAGLIVEEGASEWQLRYAFYGEGEAGWVHVLVSAPLAEKVFPSVVEWIHAADWHEREAEDLFGVRFEGHPHLGDFVLHDDVWQEGVEPMRHGFDAQAAMRHRRPNVDWRPRRIVQEPGAFIMPIGPKFSGVTESVHFLLETVGEDVIRSSTRLFYKWRAVEKLAEGKTVEEGPPAGGAVRGDDGLCSRTGVLPGRRVASAARRCRRARARCGYFWPSSSGCGSTPARSRKSANPQRWSVATSQAGLLEEELLRVSGELTGHRYLFGLLAPGGLLCDLPTDACRRALERAQDILKRLDELERRLSISSSFLDRIEEVGVISAADREGLQPGRSGCARVGTRPRSAPRRCRIRVTRRSISMCRANAKAMATRGFGCCSPKARQSVRIMEQAVAALTEGEVCRAGAIPFGCRAGLGRGAARRNLPLGETGRRRTDRALPVITPSFTNWHSFHLAAEKFAFQDFPIILSTFDLSHPRTASPCQSLRLLWTCCKLSPNRCKVAARLVAV